MATWDPTHTYAINDLVTYSGINYISLQNSNLNHEPDLTVGTWWGYVVAVSKLTGYAPLFPEMQVSKLTGYSVLFPELQVSKLTGYGVLFPELQVSKLTGYAVLFPANQRPFLFKASLPS
jgi:hypothetical protein